MTKRRATPTLLVAIAALLSGCQERPTAPSVPEGPDPQLARGGNQGPEQTLTFIFRSSEFSSGSDLIIGDGRFPDEEGRTYTDGECGVAALIPGYNGDAGLNTKSSKIKPSEEAACGGREGRYFEVSFDDRLDDGYPDLDWDDRSVQAKWMSIDNVLSIPKGATDRRLMKITFEDKSDHGVGGNGWGQACPFLLRFGWPETQSSLAQVTRVQQRTAGDALDEWRVEAVHHDDELPDGDVAVCLGLEQDQPTVLGYYHVPFGLTLICEGEC